MTVGELIDRLEFYDDDDPVHFLIGPGCHELRVTEEDAHENGGVSFELSPIDEPASWQRWCDLLAGRS